MPVQGIRTKEVADTLGVTSRTVTRFAERGEIPAFKVGDGWRFHGQDILDYIEKQKQKRRPPLQEGRVIFFRYACPSSKYFNTASTLISPTLPT